MRGSFMAIGVACTAFACGPSVKTDGGGTTATSTSGLATSPSTSSTTTSSTTSSSTSTSSTSGTTGGSCMSCEEGTIPVDQAAEEGYSAKDVVDTFDGLTLPVTWTIDGLEPTTLSLGMSHDGTPVNNEAGEECCDPCAFLYVPCSGGLRFTANAILQTADGMLAESGTVEIWTGAASSDGLVKETWTLSGQIPAAELQGSLKDMMITVDGQAVVIEALRVQITRQVDDGQVQYFLLLSSGESGTLLAE